MATARMETLEVTRPAVWLVVTLGVVTILLSDFVVAEPFTAPGVELVLPVEVVVLVLAVVGLLPVVFVRLLLVVLLPVAVLLVLPEPLCVGWLGVVGVETTGVVTATSPLALASFHSFTPLSAISEPVTVTLALPAVAALKVSVATSLLPLTGVVPPGTKQVMLELLDVTVLENAPAQLSLTNCSWLPYENVTVTALMLVPFSYTATDAFEPVAALAEVTLNAAVPAA